MANWYGSARTNFVRVENPEGLKRSIEDFGLVLEPHPVHVDVYCLVSTDESGGMPSTAIDGEEEFSWKDHVMPHLPVGEVLIVVEAGAEKLRYVSAYAEAYVRDPDGRPQGVTVSIGDITTLASQRFGIPVDNIASPTYQEFTPPEKRAQSNKEVTFVRGAFATGDDMDGPGFASFKVNQRFLSRIDAMKAACNDANLTEVRAAMSPDWGPGDVESDMRLQCGELVVVKNGDFWFRDYGKHRSDHIETRGFNYRDLCREFAEAADGATVILGLHDNAEELLQAYQEDQEDRAVQAEDNQNAARERDR